MSQPKPDAKSFTVKDISKMMAKQDLAMLITRHGDDSAVRPMSNNRDVEFDGDTFFFSTADTLTVQDIKDHKRVTVSYQDTDDGLFMSMSGAASLHTDQKMLKEHWKDNLEKWFEDGLDTEGLTLIEVNADRIHYWSGRDEGEITLDN